MNRYGLILLGPLSLLAGACAGGSPIDATNTTGGAVSVAPATQPQERTTPLEPAGGAKEHVNNVGLTLGEREARAITRMNQALVEEIEADYECERQTWIEQGDSASDLELAQRMRDGLIGDDSLSEAAKNVTIITSEGVIALRGRVRDAAERDRIDAKARRLVAPDRIDDALTWLP